MFDALRRQVEALENRVSKVEQRARKNSGDIVLLKGRIERVERVVRADGNRSAGRAGVPSRVAETASLAGRRGKVAVGGGFYLSNVTFRGGSLGTEMIGEISNQSGRDYDMVAFDVSLYKKPRRLVEHDFFLIHNIKNGQTRSFRLEFFSSVQ